MPRLRLIWLCVIGSAATLAVTVARGQQGTDAGKTGPQLFADDCSACHRSPRGLSKNKSGGSLVSFLRQHYTSSAASANTVAAYVLSAGGAAADRQKGDKQSPPDRAKLARPTEPGTSGQPGAQPPTKQRDQLARPSDAAVDRNGRPARKSRRPGAADPAASAAAPVAPAASATASPAEPPTNTVPFGSEAPPAAAAGQPAEPDSAATAAAQPGFSEPLP